MKKFTLRKPSSGILGMILIALFTINAGFSGTRLGLCWVMLEERYSEFKGEVRDPYPAIAEKAIGRVSNIVEKIGPQRVGRYLDPIFT